LTSEDCIRSLHATGSKVRHRKTFSLKKQPSADCLIMQSIPVLQTSRDLQTLGCSVYFLEALNFKLYQLKIYTYYMQLFTF